MGRHCWHWPFMRPQDKENQQRLRNSVAKTWEKFRQEILFYFQIFWGITWTRFRAPLIGSRESLSYIVTRPLYLLTSSHIFLPTQDLERCCTRPRLAVYSRVVLQPLASEHHLRFIVIHRVWWLAKSQKSFQWTLRKQVQLWYRRGWVDKVKTTPSQGEMMRVTKNYLVYIMISLTWRPRIFPQ